MKYGFVIDNRKCIGCHACTTACKSEHEVPVGVNRTWVKQVEKGEFPDTRRLFSVMRCNHCTDAPCVEICPTESLYIRNDGIVDFDKDRCIGCKSCMQACPYDALYIDPQTHTAAKCNYCASRIDIGLEPACVNVCPEHAIISGDMEDATSEIAQLLARQQVSVRKAEKGTQPNLFYIDADEASLNPNATVRDGQYLWSSQSLGVGHYAKEAEKMAFSNHDLVAAVLEADQQYTTVDTAAGSGSPKSVEVLMGKTARRVYDTPNKGILWAWEVSAYVWTKAIATGIFLVPALALLFGWAETNSELWAWSYGLSLLFLAATGVLLVLDLDQPRRFAYVLLRPHWNSWLVKGGYSITIFGGLLVAGAFAQYADWAELLPVIHGVTIFFAILVAVYTAFLFAQAKGRDFWQSPSLAMHMLVHSLMAGASGLALLALFIDLSADWMMYVRYLLLVAIGFNVATLLLELGMPHPTVDAKRVVHMITRGRYAKLFYGGVLLVGNIIPLLLLIFGEGQSLLFALAGLAVLFGIYCTEHIWVEAPQRIPLS